MDTRSLKNNAHDLTTTCTRLGLAPETKAKLSRIFPGIQGLNTPNVALSESTQWGLVPKYHPDITR